MAAIVQINKGVAVTKFEIKKPLIRIGRKEDNDICIDDKVVSTEHAVIEMIKEKNKSVYYIRDLGSTNHTYVNGESISRVLLQNEDMIRIGWVTFKFLESIDKHLEKTIKIHKSWIPGVYYTKE